MSPVQSVWRSVARIWRYSAAVRLHLRKAVWMLADANFIEENPLRHRRPAR
jgi:hypothetical protein